MAGGAAAEAALYTGPGAPGREDAEGILRRCPRIAGAVRPRASSLAGVESTFGSADRPLPREATRARQHLVWYVRAARVGFELWWDRRCWPPREEGEELGRRASAAAASGGRGARGEKDPEEMLGSRRLPRGISTPRSVSGASRGGVALAAVSAAAPVRGPHAPQDFPAVTKKETAKDFTRRSIFY